MRAHVAGLLADHGAALVLPFANREPLRGMLRQMINPGAFRQVLQISGKTHYPANAILVHLTRGMRKDFDEGALLLTILGNC